MQISKVHAELRQCIHVVTDQLQEVEKLEQVPLNKEEEEANLVHNVVAGNETKQVNSTKHAEVAFRMRQIRRVLQSLNWPQLHGDLRRWVRRSGETEQNMRDFLEQVKIHDREMVHVLQAARHQADRCLASRDLLTAQQMSKFHSKLTTLSDKCQSWKAEKDKDRKEKNEIEDAKEKEKQKEEEKRMAADRARVIKLLTSKVTEKERVMRTVDRANLKVNSKGATPTAHNPGAQESAGPGAETKDGSLTRADVELFDDGRYGHLKRIYTRHAQKITELTRQIEKNERGLIRIQEQIGVKLEAQSEAAEENGGAPGLQVRSATTGAKTSIKPGAIANVPPELAHRLMLRREKDALSKFLNEVTCPDDDKPGAADDTWANLMGGMQMTPEPEESKTDPAQQQQQQLQGLAAVPKPVVPIPVAEVKVDLPSASEIAASLNLNESDDPMNAQILVLEAQQKEICSKAESLLDEVNNKSRMMSLGKAWEFDPKSFSYWFLLNPQKPMVDVLLEHADIVLGRLPATGVLRKELQHAASGAKQTIEHDAEARQQWFENRKDYKINRWKAATDQCIDLLSSKVSLAASAKIDEDKAKEKTRPSSGEGDASASQKPLAKAPGGGGALSAEMEKVMEQKHKEALEQIEMEEVFVRNSLPAFEKEKEQVSAQSAQAEEIMEKQALVNDLQKEIESLRQQLESTLPEDELQSLPSAADISVAAEMAADSPEEDMPSSQSRSSPPDRQAGRAGSSDKAGQAAPAARAGRAAPQAQGGSRKTRGGGNVNMTASSQEASGACEQCGNVLKDDSNFCRKCGLQREEQGYSDDAPGRDEAGTHKGAAGGRGVRRVPAAADAGADQGRKNRRQGASAGQGATAVRRMDSSDDYEANQHAGFSGEGVSHTDIAHNPALGDYSDHPLREQEQKPKRRRSRQDPTEQRKASTEGMDDISAQLAGMQREVRSSMMVQRHQAHVQQFGEAYESDEEYEDQRRQAGGLGNQNATGRQNRGAPSGASSGGGVGSSAGVPRTGAGGVNRQQPTGAKGAATTAGKAGRNTQLRRISDGGESDDGLPAFHEDDHHDEELVQELVRSGERPSVARHKAKNKNKEGPDLETVVKQCERSNVVLRRRREAKCNAFKRVLQKLGMGKEASQVGAPEIESEKRARFEKEMTELKETYRNLLRMVNFWEQRIKQREDKIAEETERLKAEFGENWQAMIGAGGHADAHAADSGQPTDQASAVDAIRNLTRRQTIRKSQTGPNKVWAGVINEGPHIYDPQDFSGFKRGQDDFGAGAFGMAEKELFNIARERSSVVDEQTNSLVRHIIAAARGPKGGMHFDFDSLGSGMGGMDAAAGMPHGMLPGVPGMMPGMADLGCQECRCQDCRECLGCQGCQEWLRCQGCRPCRACLA